MVCAYLRVWVAVGIRRACFGKYVAINRLAAGFILQVSKFPGTENGAVCRQVIGGQYYVGIGSRGPKLENGISIGIWYLLQFLFVIGNVRRVVTQNGMKVAFPRVPAG